MSRTNSSPISLPLTSARANMGPPPSPQPPPHAHGLCFFAPWAWLRGIGEHSPNSWRIDGMEGGDGGGPAGLRFLLQFDPTNPGSFDRTLLGFSLSALFSRLLGWSKDAQRRGGGGSMAIAVDGGDDSVNTAVSAAALAAALSLCLAAMYASDQRPRRRRLPAPPTSGARFEQSVLRFVRVLDLTLALIMFPVDFSCSSAASRSSCSS